MKNKILALLVNNNYLFDLDTTSIKEESLVDKNVIYTIYKRRLMVSEKVTQQLVENLNLYKGNKIKLVTIEDKNGDEFLIFTTEDASAFIGIIKLT